MKNAIEEGSLISQTAFGMTDLGSCEAVRWLHQAEKTKPFKVQSIRGKVAQMKRPVIVTAIGLLLIVAGAVGFVYHFRGPYDRDFAAIEAVRALAVVGGVFLLMGRGWARWLVLFWLGFHLGISALDSVGKFAFHLVLLLVIGYALLRPPASEYFRATKVAG